MPADGIKFSAVIVVFRNVIPRRWAAIVQRDLSDHQAGLGHLVLRKTLARDESPQAPVANALCGAHGAFDRAEAINSLGKVPVAIQLGQDVPARRLGIGEEIGEAVAVGVHRVARRVHGVVRILLLE